MANRVNKTLSLDRGQSERLTAFKDMPGARHGDISWHTDNAFRLYFEMLDGKVKVTKVNKSKAVSAPKKSKEVAMVSVDLDFMNWPYVPEGTLIPRWLDAKKKAGGSVAQAVITRVGEELQKLITYNFCIEQALEKAIENNWKGFDSEWFIGRVHPESKEDFVAKHTDRSWAD